MRCFKRNIIWLALIGLLLWNCKNDDDTTSTLNTQVTTYGGSKNDSAQSVTSTLDGGFVVLGHTQSTDGDVANKTNQSYDYWLLKCNDQAQIQWQKTYGGSLDDRGTSIIQTQDGGYAVLGSSTSADGQVTTNAGAQDFWVAKLDANGNMVWQKSFGYSGSDKGISLIQTQDNGYLLTGIIDVTASGGQGNSRHAGGDYWAIKLDVNGTLVWRNYFGGNFTDTPYDVTQTQDNGYLIVGSSDSNDTDISNNIGTYDFWVVKLSALGDLVWEKNFGGTEIDEARAITTTHDGNYIIVGDTRSNDGNITSNKGAADLWLIKITPNGNLLWEKTFGGTNFDAARAIAKTQDNSFVIAGSSRSNNGNLTTNKGQNDAWALKVNAEGYLIWQTTIGGSNIDFGYGITQLNNGNIVMVGDTFSNDGDITENKGFTDALIVKIEE